MESPKRARAVERILEDEMLTADLVDAAAHLLLTWGAARVKVLVAQADDWPEEVFIQEADELRRTLRRIARLAGQELLDDQLKRVQELIEGEE